jgi:arylsulfatase A-like enzyme
MPKIVILRGFPLSRRRLASGALKRERHMPLHRPARLLVGSLILLAGLMAATPPQVSAGAKTRPNVLVIMTDDQRAGTLRHMPFTRKWFVRGGRNYPEAFTTTPVCCPARASVLTGRYVHNHGVLTNGDADALDTSTTLTRYLRDAGYLTAMAGKFLNSWPVDQAPADFDRFAMMKHPGTGGYFDAIFNVKGTVGPVAGYSTDFIRKRSVEFLQWFEQDDKRPWFLYVTPYAPHGPATPAPRHTKAEISRWEPTPGVFEEDRSDKPSFVQARSVLPGQGGFFRKKQTRSLMAVDEMVQRLMMELGKLGEDRRTLAFYMSDNGHLWAEHGLMDKRVAYPESIRIPLLTRWPGVIPAGSIDRKVALNVDIAPTVMIATGADTNPGVPMDGRNLLGPHGRDRVFTEYETNSESNIPTWASLLTPTEQYVEYYQDGEVTFREYYDRTVDPWHLENLLAPGYPVKGDLPSSERLAILQLQLARDRECFGTTGASACP